MNHWFRLFALLLTPFGRALCAAGSVLFVVGLYWVNSRPESAGLLPHPWDWIVHFVMFGGFAVLLWFALGGRRPVLAVLLVSAYGALDEWRQMYLPGRDGGFEDWVVDTIAAVVAVSILAYLSSVRRAALAAASE